MHAAPEVGDMVLPLGNHGRWEIVRVEGNDAVIKLLTNHLDTGGPEDLGEFQQVPLSTLTVYKKKR